MPPSSRGKLTEKDWQLVFKARCESKQGRALTPEARALVEAAWREDKERYAAMERDVFNATVPFGSTVRR